MFVCMYVFFLEKVLGLTSVKWLEQSNIFTSFRKQKKIGLKFSWQPRFTIYMRFLWCWFSLLFYLTVGFYVSVLLLLPPALHPGFSGPWRPPPALSSTLATIGCSIFARLFRHSFTASATVLTRRFLPRGVVYLALLPQVGQMVEFGHFGQIVECSFTN